MSHTILKTGDLDLLGQIGKLPKFILTVKH